MVLEKYDSGRANSTWNIVSSDETWVCQFDPETKAQSSVWLFPGDTLPLKFKVRGAPVNRCLLRTLPKPDTSQPFHWRKGALWPQIGVCITASPKCCFNYTYYTVAHKCNKRQLFAIPASYENNIALAKPEGRGAHARLDPLFRQPFSSWPCTIVQLSSFHFSCHLIEFCWPPVCSCFHFRPREKPMWSVWAAKREWKGFRHFLATLLPTLLPPFV